MTMTATDMHDDHTRHRSCGGRLVAADQRELPLRSAHLDVDACAGYARVRLTQQFVNSWSDPLDVSYALPLPHEAAVSGFAFQLGERRIVGNVEGLAEARDRYERALISGRSAGLLEQQRGALFTLELGNVPPRTTLVAEITVDQPLSWLDEGAWEFRFPTVVAPRYLGAEGVVPDADRIVQDVTQSTTGPSLGLGLRIRDVLQEDARPASPSHPLRIAPGESDVQVELDGDEPIALDRDLVVRWPVALPEPGVTLDVGYPGPSHPAGDRAYGLLTVVPPGPSHRHPAIARDLILLVDTSGSMHGAPMEQARRVATGVIESLEQGDSLEVLAFANSVKRWRPGPVPADADARRSAIEWVRGLDTGGGTEMVSGVREALRPVSAGAQRQVVFVTDGLVGFEADVVRAILDAMSVDARIQELGLRLAAEVLPQREAVRSRLHCVGVGPAVNGSLLGQCARAGRGTHGIVGLEEEVAPVLERLLARLTHPLLTELEVSGEPLPGEGRYGAPDVLARGPARIPLSLDPAGGELVIRGRSASGPWERQVQVPRCGHATGSPAVASLYAREVVEVLELRASIAPERGAVDAAIERLGLDYQIATRLTPWVAVSEERTVEPGGSVRRVTQPQRLPVGLSAEGLGLRKAAYEGGAGAYRSACTVDGSVDFNAAPDLSAVHRIERDFLLAPPMRELHYSGNRRPRSRSPISPPATGFIRMPPFVRAAEPSRGGNGRWSAHRGALGPSFGRATWTARAVRGALFGVLYVIRPHGGHHAHEAPDAVHVVYAADPASAGGLEGVVVDVIAGAASETDDESAEDTLYLTLRIPETRSDERPVYLLLFGPDDEALLVEVTD